MRSLILTNFQSPGDTVVLTGAVRDLQASYPGEFRTDVRTPYPELWDQNPHLTEIEEDDPEALEIRCEYPLVRESNRAPHHFLHGFVRNLNEKLGLDIRPTRFGGDIHLSGAERRWPECLAAELEPYQDYWVVVSGGKRDFTVKWWDPARLQRVVDHFEGRIRFVQVGAGSDHHPPLSGVVDLRGRTDLRELVRVIYHARGVLTPVSLAMHLAAAVETPPGHPPARPCVVVAGGREPPHWEAYPHHQFIHTVGALGCCADGGCWKSRAYPLGDGSEHDHPRRLCTNLVGPLPRCMNLIGADDVIRRIETYYDGGVIAYGNAGARAIGPAAPGRVRPAAGVAPSPDGRLTPENAARRAERFLAAVAAPPALSGRGIVICGGGRRYFPSAWVCIHMLRDLGCTLPIELWYLGPLEMDERMKALVRPLGVTCRDGRSHLKEAQRARGVVEPWRRLGGFELKPYALVHSSFREVLFLDADNVPVIDPEYLFELPEYRRDGALFWPDFGRLAASREVWRVCGVAYRDEPEFESGQIVVDKSRCWEALQLTLWYNENSGFFYRYIHGDKDTFHMAFRKVGKSYAMPPVPIHPLDYTMCQHDFDGQRVFQHRNQAKWALRQPNLRIHDFWLEEECLHHLRELDQKWDGRIEPEPAPAGDAYQGTSLAPVAERLAAQVHRYYRVGYDSRLLSFRAGGVVGQGAAQNELYWDLHHHEGGPLLELGSLDRATCLLRTNGSGAWQGRWLRHERMPIELVPA